MKMCFFELFGKAVMRYKSCQTKSFLHFLKKSLNVTWGVSGSPGILDPAQNLKHSLLGVTIQNNKKEAPFLNAY